MKKVTLALTLIAMVALFSGCGGKALSFITNGLAFVEAVLCTATPAMKAEAAEAKTYIEENNLQGRLAKAYQTFDTIRTTGCYIASELRLALQFFAEATAKTKGVRKVPALAALKEAAS